MKKAADLGYVTGDLKGQVNGHLYEGVPTGNPGSTYDNGNIAVNDQTVYLQVRDEGGANVSESPWFKAKTHSFPDVISGNGGDGTYSFLNKDGGPLTWKDSDGKTRQFLALNNQSYRFWVDNYKDPDTGSTLTPVRQAGGMSPGEWVSSETQLLGAFQLVGSSLQKTATFMYEAPTAPYVAKDSKESPLATLNSNQARTTTEHDNYIAGRVWLETGAGDQNLTAANGPRYDAITHGGDVLAPGYTVYGTILSPEGFQYLSQLDMSGDPKSQVAKTQAILKEHPEYIAQTRYQKTDADGRYTLQFDKINGQNPSLNRVYMWVENDKGEVEPTYSAFMKPLFVEANVGQWKTASDATTYRPVRNAYYAADFAIAGREIENPLPVIEKAQGQNLTVKVGETPEAKSGISNSAELPKGTTYAFKETPDTSKATPADKPIKSTVVVTYPNGQTQDVPVDITVKAVPQGKEQSVEKGQTPKAEDSIENLKDLPEGTKYAFKDPVDTSTTGKKPATVVVTYPDGSKDEVPVTVKVTDPAKKDADNYDPKAKDQSVEKGQTPKAEDSIENLKDLPEGTKYAFKDPVDTSTTGKKPATVVVTYPDGSKDEVPVTVKVTDPESATTETPVIDPIKEGDDSVTGKTEPGAKVTVTFPDGKTGEATADKNGKFEVKVPDGTKLESGKTVKVTAKAEGKAPSEGRKKISDTANAEGSIPGLTEDQANKCVGASAASAIPLLLLTPIALGLAMDNQQVKDLTAGFGQQLEDINTGIQKTLGIYNPELAQQFKVQVAPHLQNLVLAAGFVASIALLAGVAATKCVPGGGSSDNTSSQK